MMVSETPRHRTSALRVPGHCLKVYVYFPHGSAQQAWLDGLDHLGCKKFVSRCLDSWSVVVSFDGLLSNDIAQHQDYRS